MAFLNEILVGGKKTRVRKLDVTEMSDDEIESRVCREIADARSDGWEHSSSFPLTWHGSVLIYSVFCK